jgi:hypothetical protein
MNALVAARSVLVPTPLDFLSVAGLRRGRESRSNDDLGGEPAIVLAPRMVGVRLADREMGGVRVADARAVPDRAPTQRAAGVRPEQLLELAADLARVARALVDLRSHDAEVAQRRIVVLAHLLDRLHEHGEALA